MNSFFEFWSERERRRRRKEEFHITNEIKLPPKTENIISLPLSLPFIIFYKKTFFSYLFSPPALNFWLWHFAKDFFLSFQRYIAQTVTFTGNIIMVIIVDISPDTVSYFEFNIFNVLSFSSLFPNYSFLLSFLDNILLQTRYLGGSTKTPTHVVFVL